MMQLYINMKILIMIFGTIVLSMAQIPYRFRHQGFRNLRPPLATSASREIPYLSIPIVLMPDGQMIPKSAHMNYKHATSPPIPIPQRNRHSSIPVMTEPAIHYQIAVPPPSLKEMKDMRTSSELESSIDASIIANAQKQLRNIGNMHQNRPNSYQNVNIQLSPEQQQRNNVVYQHSPPKQQNTPNKQHMVNFLNFASEIGGAVLAQQLGKEIAVSSKHNSPIKISGRPENYIVQGVHLSQTTGNSPAHQVHAITHGQSQIVQGIPVETYAVQQAQEHQSQNPDHSSMHPFQGIHLQKATQNIQNTDEHSSTSPGQNSQLKFALQTHGAQQNFNSKPSKETQISYAPQYHSISLQPQNGRGNPSEQLSENDQQYVINIPNSHIKSGTTRIFPQTIRQPSQTDAPIQSQQYSGHHENGKVTTSYQNPSVQQSNPTQYPAGYSYAYAPNYVVHRIPASEESHKHTHDPASQSRHIYTNGQSVIVPAEQIQTTYTGLPPKESIPQQPRYEYIVQNSQNKEIKSSNQQETSVVENEKVIYTTPSAEEIRYAHSIQGYSPEQVTNDKSPITYAHANSYYGHQSPNQQHPSTASSVNSYGHSTNGHQSVEKDSPKTEKDENEDTNYKVVYIPLDILKNILHNSVDGQKSEKQS